MPITPTFPGVYIQEVPSGVRTIVGVATSIAAFIDRFARGPAEVPVRLFSMADFEREFGGLTATSAASYGIRQFFLNGGTEVYAVRVQTNDDDTAGIVLPGGAGGAANVIQVNAGRRVGGVSVEDPGAWGNSVM